VAKPRAETALIDSAYLVLADVLRKPYSLVFPMPQRSPNQHEPPDLRIDVIGVNQHPQVLYRSIRMWHAKSM
jgi:hypothetical protein